MKATLRSGATGLVTVDVKAERRKRRQARGEEPPAGPVEPPLVWGDQAPLPPPPPGHDGAGRNER